MTVPRRPIWLKRLAGEKVHSGRRVRAILHVHNRLLVREGHQRVEDNSRAVIHTCLVVNFDISSR